MDVNSVCVCGDNDDGDDVQITYYENILVILGLMWFHDDTQMKFQ